MRKKGFAKWDGSSWLTMILMLAGIGVMVLSIVKLWGIFSDYHRADALYDQATEMYVTEKTDSTDVGTAAEKQEPTQDEPEWYELVDVDLEGVQKVNPDVIAWIFFENEDISYPVLQAEDNDTYLRTTYLGEAATAGSIFMEADNAKDFTDKHTLIYGHNMKNLSMFGKLKYYKNQKGYYEEHKYFQIFTNDVVCRYEIIAYRDVAVSSEIYTLYGKKDTGFQKFAADVIMAGNYLDTDMTIREEDHVITLSTCSDDNDRFVVSAVRVDEHER